MAGNAASAGSIPPPELIRKSSLEPALAANGKPSLLDILGDLTGQLTGAGQMASLSTRACKPVLGEQLAGDRAFSNPVVNQNYPIVRSAFDRARQY